ncbi:MAG: ABC transporter transmembrane domain-containing protein, partial [Microbacterium sp.]
MTTVAPRALLGATLRSHRGRILAAAAFLGGHQVCEALVPVAIGVTLDVGFAGETAWPLVACLAGMLALFLVLNQCWRWYARLGEGAAFDEAHRRRVGGLRGLLARRDADPPGGSGELVTILTGDADSHARWSTWIPGLAGAVAALAVCGVVLFSTDAVIAAVLLGTAVVVSAALLALSPLLAARFERQQAALGRTLDLGADLTAGLDTLRGLRAVGAAIARFRTRSDAARDAAVKAGYSASLQTGLTVLGSSVVVLVAIALAGARWLAGEMSVGELVALVGIAQFITEPLTALGHYVKFSSISWASTRRLATLPDAAADEPAPAGPAARTVQDDGNPLVVRPGELVAVVAETVPPLALPGATTRLDEPRTAYLFR